MKTIAFIPVTEKSAHFFYETKNLTYSKPTIVQIYETVKKCKNIDEVYVCFEGNKIKKLLNKYKIPNIQTSRFHKTGTDRIGEALIKLRKKFDIILNIFSYNDNITPYQIIEMVNFHKKNYDYEICIPLEKIEFPENQNLIKVVINKKNEILYLSRNKIPSETTKRSKNFLVQSNIISFKFNGLMKFINLNQTKYELIENVELLRAIESSVKIKSFIMNTNSYNKIHSRQKSFR